jgi:AcrR family transcriptional regulator
MTDLPVSYQAAWGIHEPTGRGPKRGLTLDRVVDAGVAVATSEGLEAVSMSRVARELKAATMALYRYVATKDELLMLMMDAVFAHAPAVRRPSEAWRPALARWARAHLAVLRRHPWIVRIPLSGPPITPNQVMWFERALRSLSGTGLSEQEKLSTLLLVNGFVRNEALLASDIQAAAAARGATVDAASASYGRTLAELVDARRFPALSATIASGVFDRIGDVNEDFDFGLSRILDGVEVLVRARRAKKS